MRLGYATKITSKSATNWLGSEAKDKDFVASVSTITYVNKNSLPTFIVYGDADPTVPYQQSVDIHKKSFSSWGEKRIYNCTGWTSWQVR